MWGLQGDAFNGHAFSAAGGFVIYRTVSTPAKFGVSDTKSEEHLSVQVGESLREGIWEVQSGDATVVYTADRSDAKTRPACVGVATDGTVRVTMTGSGTAAVSLDLIIEFVEIPHRKPFCLSGPLALQFSANILDGWPASEQPE
jgi:hypothetical protein